MTKKFCWYIHSKCNGTLSNCFNDAIMSIMNTLCTQHNGALCLISHWESNADMPTEWGQAEGDQNSLVGCASFDKNLLGIAEHTQNIEYYQDCSTV